jgi:GxxExxY protein
MSEKTPLIYEVLSGNVRNAAFEVHSILGCGFLEGVYSEALAYEFELRKIPYKLEPEFGVTYKDKLLSKKYQPDFTVEDKIVIEIKALTRLTNIEIAQIINYLKVTGYKLGLLINFGTTKLEFRRIIL